MTTVFKNIECSVSQLATTMTLIDSYIKEQKEMIELYKEQLNGSDNTEQVRFYQTTIKDKKANIKSMIALQEQMATKELITNTLYNGTRIYNHRRWILQHESCKSCIFKRNWRYYLAKGCYSF